MIKKFKFKNKNKMYVAVIQNEKLIQVAKDGVVWKDGEIYDFALNKFKSQSNGG